MLLVMADAGMGKTRLAEEAASLAECEQWVTVLEGRCVPYGEANAWWPVAEALRATCGVASEDEIDAARKQVHIRVPGAFRCVEACSDGENHISAPEQPLLPIHKFRWRAQKCGQFVHAIVHSGVGFKMS
jgi:hypothetical protein